VRSFDPNRRAFLWRTSALAISSALAGPVGAGPASGRHALGIQLYTMRELLAHDFAGTLAALGRIGYREVETVGLFGRDAKSFRAGLDAAGLTAPSAHIFPQVAQDWMLQMALGRITPEEAWPKIDATMDLDHIESIMGEMFEQAAVLGHQYLVFASVDPKLLRSVAGIERIITAFRTAGDLCHQRGLKFAWHPHLDEFGRLDGKRVVERVLDATDPDKVFVELDFFWAVLARVDVPALLKQYSGRFHLAHVKDIAKSVSIPGGPLPLSAVTPQYFEDVGYGQLDYRAWIPLGRKAGMRYFFVERDESPQPLENARRSYESLRKLL
jgi:sugar phosphate isomerase/epimerase